MPNLNAALACAQLEQLNLYVKSKRETAKKYEAYFKNTEIQFCSEPPNSISNYWLNSIILPSYKEQIEFLQFTNDNGVMTRPIWKTMDKLAMFQNCMKADLSNSNYLEERLVNLPSSVIL
jgi:dTDP-4-amino-4,6-dideoxygalactose transaminase